MAKIEGAVDKLVVMRSCQWKEKKAEINFQSKLSKFIGKSKISEKDILENVESGEFFGLVKVDIYSPEDVIKKYEHLNFPFIFNKISVSEDMLCDKVLELSKAAKRTFPQEALTLTYNAKNIILATPLLKFYLSLGMKVSNLDWAMQYIPTKPFQPFVKEMVDVRIRSFGTNAPLGDRAKFTLNSAVGRFG